MKRILLFILVASISFYLGSVLCAKTGIKHTTSKVYDFSQDNRAMKIYANMMGYELVNKDIVCEQETIRKSQEHTIWQAGYEEGFKIGFQNGISKSQEIKIHSIEGPVTQEQYKQGYNYLYQTN